MASLIKQDNLYYLQFYSSSRSPQRKRVALKVSRKREAKPIARRLEALYASGEFDPWHDDALATLQQREREPVTVEEALTLFLDAKRQAGRRESTLRTYRHIIGLLVQQVGDVLLRDVPARTLSSFCHDDSVAPATRRTRHKHLQAFLRWCKKHGHLQHLPDLETPPGGDTMPKAVRPEHLDQMERELRRDYKAKLEDGRCREGELVWMVDLWRFALYTGLRASELGRLRWKDVDTERGLVSIREQKNRREQTVPLSSRAATYLPDRGEDTDYVFGSQERSVTYFREHASRYFRRYRRAAGLSDDLSFHGLRHGFCTLLAEAGVSPVAIKEAARHGSIETTMRYVHMARTRLRSEIEEALG